MKSCVLLGMAILAIVDCASWDYADHGPDTWSTDHPTCAGQNQSPIDVVEADAKYRDMSLVLEGYSAPTSWEVKNNGHTISAVLPSANLGMYTVDAKDTYNYASHRWSLAQFHMHWDQYNDVGSENMLNGQQYPMEVHFVHINNKYTSDHQTHADGLLVLAFFFEIGKENLAFNTLFQTIPLIRNKGNSTVSAPLAPVALISGSVEANEFFTWRGSLTTPGCDEAVSWHLFKKPIQISQSQMDMVRYSLYENAPDAAEVPMSRNWRPVQALSGRKVYHNIVPVVKTPSGDDVCTGGATMATASFVMAVAAVVYASLIG